MTGHFEVDLLYGFDLRIGVTTKQPTGALVVIATHKSNLLNHMEVQSFMDDTYAVHLRKHIIGKKSALTPVPCIADYLHSAA